MTLKLIASLLLLSCGSLAAIPNRQAVAPYKITAVKAMLFYDNKGTFPLTLLSRSLTGMKFHRFSGTRRWRAQPVKVRQHRCWLPLKLRVNML